MGFLMFALTMAAIAIMSTTKESRAKAIKDGDKYWPLWFINIGIVLSFFVF